MKKLIIAMAALFVFAACKKSQDTEVIDEDTIVETPADITEVDNDTIANATIEETDETEVVNEPKEVANQAKDVKVEYASFGDNIAADKALTKEQMLKKYKALKAGDTIAVKFKSTVKEVCQKKGCWMSLELPNGKESFIKFKDYAFFVPFNAAESEAIVSGKAFVSEISVAQLRHYAKDGGKSEEEIAKITEPEFKYGFMADGVLISK